VERYGMENLRVSHVRGDYVWDVAERLQAYAYNYVFC
jgi:hypothetical protein